MDYQIIWADDAMEDYNNIINYLLTFWGINVIENFEQKLRSRLFNLKHEPTLGVVCRRNKHIRSILITKHNRLYYTFTYKKVYVLNIFDTRQNPTKNIYE